MLESLNGPSLHDVEADKEKEGDAKVSPEVASIVLEVGHDVVGAGDDGGTGRRTDERADLIRSQLVGVLGDSTDVARSDVLQAAKVSDK